MKAHSVAFGRNQSWITAEAQSAQRKSENLRMQDVVQQWRLLKRTWTRSDVGVEVAQWRKCCERRAVGFWLRSNLLRIPRSTSPIWE